MTRSSPLEFPGLVLFTRDIGIKLGRAVQGYTDFSKNATPPRLTNIVISLTFAHKYKVVNGEAILDVNRDFLREDSELLSNFRDFFGSLNGSIISQRNVNIPNSWKNFNVITTSDEPLVENLAKRIYDKVESIIKTNKLDIHLVSVGVADNTYDHDTITLGVKATYFSPNWRIKYAKALKNAGFDVTDIFNKLN